MSYSVNIEDLADISLENYYNYLTKRGKSFSYSGNYDTKYGAFSHESAPVNGMVFSLSNLTFFQDTALHLDALEECCFISIPHSNHTRKNIADKKELFFNKESINLCISKQDDKYKMKCNKDDEFSNIELSISKNSLRQYLIELENFDLVKKIDDSNIFELLRSVPLSIEHKMLIHKIKNNPYHGELKKLYLENCVNGLFLSILESLRTNKKQKAIKLSKKDREMIEQAKEILIQNFQNPPTIKELSRLVATNEDKLKKGFKVLFNDTIFSTLTEHRLQIAYKNLQKSDMSVDEIAFESGYKSASSFIAVFKKRYGKTPGQMRNKNSFYIL